jgi:hypothetical protein
MAVLENFHDIPEPKAAPDPRNCRPRAAALAQALLSFRVMLAAGLAALVCLMVYSRFNDPDLWWQLKVGQIIWTTHSIPSADTFSYTAQGHSWMAHEWLSQLTIYAAYHLGGYAGLMFWLMGFTSLLFILMYVLCYLCSENPLTAFWGALFALFFGTISLAIRPLMIGNILLVTELILLELSSRDRRVLWLLPPLFALWVNCHGSFLFGMGVLFVYWVCAFAGGKWGLLTAEPWDRERRRLLTMSLPLCALALFFNPVGWRLVFYPLDTLFLQTSGMNTIVEWLPPDLRSPRGMGMIFAMLGILFLAVLRGARLQLRELWVLLVVFFLALQHLRLMFLFGLVAAPLLCRMVKPKPQKNRQPEHPVANALLIASFAAAIIGMFPSAAAIQRQITKNSPVAAVEYIRRAKLAGPMLNNYTFGGYLIWALPEHKVFIDGRADIYDWTGVFKEYNQWNNLKEDPRLLLDKYHIRFCLLHAHEAMAKIMPLLPGWRRIYADDVAVVYAR